MYEDVFRVGVLKRIRSFITTKTGVQVYCIQPHFDSALFGTVKAKPLGETLSMKIQKLQNRVRVIIF